MFLLFLEKKKIQQSRLLKRQCCWVLFADFMLFSYIIQFVLVQSNALHSNNPVINPPFEVFNICVDSVVIFRLQFMAELYLAELYWKMLQTLCPPPFYMTATVEFRRHIFVKSLPHLEPLKEESSPFWEMMLICFLSEIDTKESVHLSCLQCWSQVRIVYHKYWKQGETAFLVVYKKSCEAQ